MLHSTLDFENSQIIVDPEAWPRIESLLRVDPLVRLVAASDGGQFRAYTFDHIENNGGEQVMITMYVRNDEHVGMTPHFMASDPIHIGNFWNYMWRRFYNKVNNDDALSIVLCSQGAA